VFGSTALTAGYVPDPFTVAVDAGGPVSASYVEPVDASACRGYTTAAPTFSVNYTSGSALRLRFYFIPTDAGDPTMLVNSPAGNYQCGDDSNGTFNPQVEFSDPSSGRYDIWVGTYASDTTLSGTLYVTELDSNHP
jgi:hypothetical protein